MYVNALYSVNKWLELKTLTEHKVGSGLCLWDIWFDVIITSHGAES